MNNEIFLKMENISKEFPGVKALSHVNFEVRNGEVLALVGENGAGKSTLMKILSGMYPHNSFSGNIYINNKIVEFQKPKDSEKAGIGIIYQELELFEDLNVAENIFVGRYPNWGGHINWNEIYFNANRILDEIGIKIDVYKKVKEIGIGQQQLVEITKALSLDAKLLILDEPTAALTEVEVKLLMKILRQLKSRGIASIFIAHKLNEIFEIADRVTVLRDGHSISTDTIESLTENDIIKKMVGRDLEQRYPERRHEVGKTVLRLKSFTKYDYKDKTKKILENINLSVKEGEIVGISGLMGSGRTELIMSVFGFLKGKVEGDIFINNEKLNIKSPKEAIDLGIGLVSEDRKRYGLILDQSIIINSTLASLGEVSNYNIINMAKEVHLTNMYIKDTNTKTGAIESKIKTLSGGNQQKVLLSRSLMTRPKILFLDEPTRGIDVGAKYEIYLLMNILASQGTAIVMVSSEMPEIIGMSDRVAVMFSGKKSGELSGRDITQEKIMFLASGDKQNEIYQ